MMADENEIVSIAMWPDARLELYGHITSRMSELGYNPCDYSALDLGFELPADWPHGENAQPTLAQLVVVAKKLKLRIVIHNLEVEPMRLPEKKDDSGAEQAD
jgi:hypothetical protein